MTKLLTNCDLTWMKLSVKYITTRKLLKIMYGLNYSNVKGPLVIPYSICARKNVIWRFVCTPNPSPHPLFKNVMKIFVKIFCLSLNFRDIKIDSFAFLLSFASIIVLLESALNSLYQKQPSRAVYIFLRTPFPKNTSGRLLLLYSHTEKSIHYSV